ncbi:hypothetical protein fugu_011502 [Takifugu bimaculatus]|uniref:Uncharacterized protein n=1 Tax=Takifugu bimaculatus TaxID=433685 RepID=A0A4Z2C7T9_9TELE|nr:hypothetical protein fugu_011502 [Takifugu bimaculatus]
MPPADHGGAEELRSGFLKFQALEDARILPLERRRLADGDGSPSRNPDENIPAHGYSFHELNPVRTSGFLTHEPGRRPKKHDVRPRSQLGQSGVTTAGAGVVHAPIPSHPLTKRHGDISCHELNVGCPCTSEQDARASADR